MAVRMNMMLNASSSPDPDSPGSFTPFFPIVMGIVAAFGVAGNSMVCVVIWKSRHFRTVPNALLVSVLVSDLLVSALIVPVCIWQYTVNKIMFTVGFCRFGLPVICASPAVSLWNICAMLLDRFLAIKEPTRYIAKRTFSNAFRAITVLWLLPIVLALPMVFTDDDLKEREFGSTVQFCKEVLLFPKYVTFYSVVGVGLPTVFIVLVNMEILYLIRKRKLRLAGLQNREAGAVRNTSQVSSLRSGKIDDGASQSPLGRKLDKFVSINNWIAPPVTPFSNERHDGVCSVLPSSVPSTSKDEFTMKPMNSHIKHFCEQLTQTTPNFKANLPSSSRVKHLSCKDASSTTEHGLFTSPAVAQLSTTRSVNPSVHRRVHALMSLRREKKALVSISVIIIAVVGCWLPLLIVFNLGLHQCTECGETSQAAMTGVRVRHVFLLCPLCSALTPVIYTVFRTELRKAAFKLLRCRPR